MSIPDKQSGGVPPSSTPNAAPNTNPMPAMSPFAAHFQEQRERKKNMLMRHIDRISLSSKLVACTIAVLLIGVSVISFSIRALVNNYMLQKTDTQLSSQSQLVVNNIDLLSKNDSSGPNSYFLQIQYTDGTKDKEGNPLVVTPLMPQMQDGIVSVPILPTYGDTNGITLGQAFTTQAVAKQIITVQSDSADSQNDPANGNSNSSDTITKVLANPTANANHAAIVTARAPWRILPVTFQQNGKDRAVVYIGLSLADQIDTVNTLTRYCIVVGIAVVLLGGSLSTLIIQHTMTPLKRIEKTAAKIAAGDLSQRIPSAPENTEVGSLAASLTKLGKTVCLPRVVPGFGMECRVYRPELPMAISDFGIQEPTEQAALIRPEEIGLALVPALCYDEGGRRLGFGGGYYDRWLESFSGTTVGLCRECVLQRSLPVEPHDLGVHVLVTDRRVLRF